MGERYKLIEKTTIASDGVVYKHYDRVDKKYVSIKYKHNSSASVLNEVNLLKELKHPNIVRLTDLREDYDTFTLVFEYLPVNLKQFMEGNSWKMNDHGIIKSFLYQILSGVAYLHEQGICHLDLNPDNLMMDLSGETLKVAALGLANKCGYDRDDKLETLPYKAPEFFLGPEPSAPADMWSVGCIFAEMVTHRTLFPGDWDGAVFLEILRLNGVSTQDMPGGIGLYEEPVLASTNGNDERAKKLEDVVTGLDSTGFELLSKMLTMDPAKRITVKAALCHAYFKDLQNVF